MPLFKRYLFWNILNVQPLSDDNDISASIPFPNFNATPTGRRLTLLVDFTCNIKHAGSSVESGFELTILRFRTRPRRPSGRVLGFGAGGFQVRNSIPLEISLVWGPLHAKSYVVAKRPPVGEAWNVGEWVPAQASSSSSDRGSKSQAPSQNSLRVASKRDVNITN
ncbi:hypothetical protein AVEN_129108-1 [Araneus ventricosus]|uniref:Uncharacterized protein n=1 Tax=Araneus ventricosus TaxID=182803 RepID=A0A4Y2HHE2_ARAVE|nr:hypothetical protein AVEN_78321-1 [Araneus ventricosus]GBM64737.1 hypothetical protein AVEN_129108-1 [Araneus ventricosus]